MAYSEAASVLFFISSVLILVVALNIFLDTFAQCLRSLWLENIQSFKKTRNMCRDAKKIIGKNVVCCNMYGGYIGKLLEITNNKSLCGKVKILAVTNYPIIGYRYPDNEVKHAKREDILEFSYDNIKPYNGDVPQYQESVVLSLKNAINSLENQNNYYISKGNSNSIIDSWIEFLRGKLQIEENLLTDG